MDDHATAMKKMEMGLSVREWLYGRKINEKEWRQAFIYLSMKISLQQHGKELIMLLFMYNMTIIKSHEVF